MPHSVDANLDRVRTALAGLDGYQAETLVQMLELGAMIYQVEDGPAASPPLVRRRLRHRRRAEVPVTRR